MASTETDYSKLFANKRILIVDDNETFRNALKSSLDRVGIKTITAENGKVAQQLLALEEVDAVISDIHMPEVSGIVLTHHIKKTKPIPIILMTGFADIKETQEAHEIGADGFIPKPFKKEDLFSELKKCLKLTDETGTEHEQTKEADLDYCRVNIDEFVTGHQIKYNIFVRLSKGNFVKIAHEGQDLSVDRIRAYKEKNLHHLFLKKEDFRNYIGFNLLIADIAKTSAQISKDKKLALMRHTNEMILEHLHVNGIDEESFQSARSTLENTVSILSDHTDVFNLLNALNTCTDYLYIHSLGVSLYSTMLARQVKWSSPVTLFKVSMGGLLHDIGKKEINRSILEKPRSQFTSEEIRIYETHPMRGMEILSKTPSVPDDVVQIAYQHHEDCLGLGYPVGLSRNRIHPMAKLVSVANEFCKLVLRDCNYPGCKPEDAVKRLFMLFQNQLEPQFLVALFQLFKMTPPEDALKRTRK